MQRSAGTPRFFERRAIEAGVRPAREASKTEFPGTNVRVSMPLSRNSIQYLVWACPMRGRKTREKSVTQSERTGRIIVTHSLLGKALDNVNARKAFGLCIEVRDDTVAENRQRE